MTTIIAATSVLGTVPSWILVAIAVMAAWRISKGGAGSAVSELSKANEVLEGRLREERRAKEEIAERLGGEVRDLRVELGELRGRTDFAAALGTAFSPVIEWTINHEGHAQERHEGLLTVLDLIAKRLGPEPNGEHPLREAP